MGSNKERVGPIGLPRCAFARRDRSSSPSSVALFLRRCAAAIFSLSASKTGLTVAARGDAVEA
jgi:hypothetical protein